VALPRARASPPSVAASAARRADPWRRPPTPSSSQIHA
jgi:hypothetical protein